MLCGIQGDLQGFVKGGRVMKSLLYHSSRYASIILAENRIRMAPLGDICVSMTRSRKYAESWAIMDRDYDDGVGHILVLDRDKLRCRYRIECVDHSSGDPREEAEEAVFRDITDLDRYLVDVYRVGEVTKPDPLDDEERFALVRTMFEPRFDVKQAA